MYTFTETCQQVEALAHLEQGWNGYNAPPPTAGAIRRAICWLNQAVKECQSANVAWYQPNVSASGDEEVALSWVANDRSLNVYIDAEEATFHKTKYSDGPVAHTHGDAPQGTGQAELLHWVGQ